MLGIGAGSIELQVNNLNFRPGEIIEGVLILKLKSTTKARGLFIRLIGERTTTHVEGNHVSQRTGKIFDLPFQLDGEKDYPASPQGLSYPFKIVIPTNMSIGASPGGTLGTIANVAQMFLPFGSGQTKWFIYGHLDMQLAFDVSKKLQINIA